MTSPQRSPSRHRPMARPMAAGLALSLVVGGLSGAALSAIPPQRPEVLQNSATDIFIGRVDKIDQTEEKVPYGTNYKFTLHFTVLHVEKGGFSVGSSVAVSAWQVAKREGGWAGNQGQNRVPGKGQTWRVFGQTLAGTTTALSPNGFEETSTRIGRLISPAPGQFAFEGDKSTLIPADPALSAALAAKVGSEVRLLLAEAPLSPDPASDPTAATEPPATEPPAAAPPAAAPPATNPPAAAAPKAAPSDSPDSSSTVHRLLGPIPTTAPEAGAPALRWVVVGVE